MKKKFLTFILLICMVFSSVFIFNACNPIDPVSEWEKQWIINEQDWKKSVTTDYFTVYNEDFSNRLGNYALVYSNNVYYLSTFNKEIDGIYVKETNGANINCFKVDNTDYQQTTTISENDYNCNVQGYINVLSFIKNNRSKFTQDGLMYRYDLNGSEQELIAIKDKIGLQTIRFGYVGLTDGSGRFQIQASLNCGDAWLAIYFNTHVLNSRHGVTLKYVFDKTMLGFSNFTLTGGPSVTDVDYCEMKVTESGFYAHYPNKGTNQSDKERYVKDNDDNTYTVYVPNNSNGWNTSIINTYEFNEMRKQIIGIYIGEINSKVSEFAFEGNKIVSKTGYTFEMGKNTFSYYDIEILLNENSEMLSMTWKMKIHDKSINADSLEYNLTLTVGNVTIEFPNV